MTWLVVGSSGYIGQHIIREFLESNQKVMGLDINPIPTTSILFNEFPSINADIQSKKQIKEVFTDYKFTGVINLAALKSVEESITHSNLYHKVNFLAAKNLMNTAIESNVRFFIQSSTAAVYGEKNSGVVDEKSLTLPITPYGTTKLKAENALNSLLTKGKFRGCSLRYFNVLGAADKSLRDRSTENIVPKVSAAIKSGISPKIFGADFDTIDGSAVRDYIHVEDVARAHLLVAQELGASEIPNCINIGSGRGYSVFQVVDEILKQHKSDLKPLIVDRRKGDVGNLIANIDLAKKFLNFQPTKDFYEMIRSAID